MVAELLVLVDDFAAVRGSVAVATWQRGSVAYARPWQRGGGAYAEPMRSLCAAYAEPVRSLCGAVAAWHMRITWQRGSVAAWQPGSASPAQHLVHITPQKLMATPQLRIYQRQRKQLCCAHSPLYPAQYDTQLFVCCKYLSTNASFPHLQNFT